MEKYVPIVGYEGIYEVSNIGNVRTDKNKVTFSKLHGIRHWKQRVLKQKTDKGGYKRVTLWKNGKSKDFLVHRLVALAFLDKVQGYDLVNHIDCCTSNNHVDNLEWIDYRGNLMHAYDHQLNKEAQPVVLVNQETKESHYFYSKSEASKFLNKGEGFISHALKRNNDITEGYRIFVPNQ